MNLFMDYDDNDDNSIESLHEEIERLRKERDDARREVCEQEAYLWDEPATRSAQHIAESRGWDCFKD